MAYISPSNAGPSPAKEPFERMPKLGAENGINDWIERGIEIAEPEEERHKVRINFACFTNR